MRQNKITVEIDVVFVYTTAIFKSVHIEAVYHKNCGFCVIELLIEQPTLDGRTREAFDTVGAGNHHQKVFLFLGRRKKVGFYAAFGVLKFMDFGFGVSFFNAVELLIEVFIAVFEGILEIGDVGESFSSRQ